MVAELRPTDMLAAVWSPLPSKTSISHQYAASILEQLISSVDTSAFETDMCTAGD